MEFLKQSRRKTILSEIVHVLLNVSVAVAIFLVVYFIGSPFAAFALMLLSKWRIFAVRPRHWFAHVVSNMVDIIVGLGFVVLLAAASGALLVQLGFTALYIAWLLVLKPRSKRQYVVLQAGVGLFVGTAAIMHMSYDWGLSAVVLSLWVVGWATARHVLTAYDEPHSPLLSLIWGFVVAEIGWLTYHWTVAYSLGASGQFMLPQAALIITILGFLAERVYASYHQHGQIRMSDVGLPLLFSVSIILLLVTLFGTVNTL